MHYDRAKLVALGELGEAVLKNRKIHLRIRPDFISALKSTTSPHIKVKTASLKDHGWRPIHGCMSVFLSSPGIKHVLYTYHL